MRSGQNQKMYPAGCTNDVARYNEGLPKILKGTTSKERAGCTQESYLF